MDQYRDAPGDFVKDMLGAFPTPQQQKALDAVANGTHVSIKSGHGTGKKIIGIFFSDNRYAETEQFPGDCIRQDGFNARFHRPVGHHRKVYGKIYRLAAQVPVAAAGNQKK